MKGNPFMKKILLYIFLLSYSFCPLFCFCSCSEPDAETETFCNRSAVSFSNSIQSVGNQLYCAIPCRGMPIYRIDTETNTPVCLCMDPLCSHDSEECPFYGLSSYACLPDNNFALICNYIRKGEGYCHYLRIYNPASQRITMTGRFAEDGGFSLGPEIVADGVRIYQDSYHDEESDSNLFPLYRMDMKTGNTTPLIVDENGRPEDFSGQLLCLYKDRCFHTDFETIYSMNKDGTDSKPLCTLSESSTFYPLNFGGDSVYLLNGERNAAIRISLEDGTETVIPLQTEHTDSFQVTEDYYYYFAGEETVLGKAEVSGYADKEVVLPGGEFWRCDRNGENHEMLFCFEGDYAGIRPLEWRVVGGRFYCSYSMWIDSDGDGVYRDGDNMYSGPINGKKSWEMFYCDLETKECGILNIY